jgi:hypothetical protein
MTTCLVNGKIYIGQKHSKKFIRSYLGSGRAIILAIKKYGKENFKVRVLHTCYKGKCLNRWEIYYIKLYNSTDREIGYNIAKGGNLGSNGIIPSEKTRKLLGEAVKRAWKRLKAEGFVSRLKGRTRPPFSKEHLKHLGEGHKGFVVREETKKKLHYAILGKKRSEETRKRSSESAKARWAKIPKYKRKQSNEYIEKRKLGVKLFLQSNPNARKGHNKGMKYKKKKK